LGRTSAKTRTMPWTCRVGKANTSWDSRVSKTKVVRPLTSSLSLGEVTSLITPIESEWTETNTNMLFCTDLYPATVLFRTCEHCVRTAARRGCGARCCCHHSRPLSCRQLRQTSVRRRRRGNMRLCTRRRWPRCSERSGRHRCCQEHGTGGGGCVGGVRARNFPCRPLTGPSTAREHSTSAGISRSGGDRPWVTLPGFRLLGGHPKKWARHV